MDCRTTAKLQIQFTLHHFSNPLFVMQLKLLLVIIALDITIPHLWQPKLRLINTFACNSTFCHINKGLHMVKSTPTNDYLEAV